MKIKQLEALRKQHQSNLALKDIKQPSINKGIALALISGQTIKIRPAAEILEAARRHIAECACSYSSSERTLKFSEIFAFKSDELTEYQQAKKRRDTMIAAYSKKAEKILRRAEMDETFDATEASEALAEAAHEAGLLN